MPDLRLPYEPDDLHRGGDGLIDKLLSNIPESWDGEDAAEAIVVDYVREIERRLIALGGTCERIATVGTSTVADRRREAREAARMLMPPGVDASWPDAVLAAVTVATRVRITRHALAAYERGWAATWQSVTPVGPRRREAGLRAALTELGFEVTR